MIESFLKPSIFLMLKMELKILDQSKNKVTLEVIGWDIGYINLVRKELWNDEKLKIAGYQKEHPQKENTKFIIETSTQKKAIEAIHEAVKRVKKDINKIKKEVDNSLKK